MADGAAGHRGDGGRYGDGATDVLPNWVDLLVVIGFSLGIYYWAVNVTLSHEETQEAVSRDASQLDYLVTPA